MKNQKQHDSLPKLLSAMLGAATRESIKKIQKKCA